MTNAGTPCVLGRGQGTKEQVAYRVCQAVIKVLRKEKARKKWGKGSGEPHCCKHVGDMVTSEQYLQEERA
jgi:hypothetical protein